MPIQNPGIPRRSEQTIYNAPVGNNGAATPNSTVLYNVLAEAAIRPNRPVRFSTTGYIEAVAATEKIAGVSTGPAVVAGQSFDMVVSGVTRCARGATAVAVGDLLTAGTGAGAVTGAAGNRCLGVALTTAANAGDLIDIIVEPGTV